MNEIYITKVIISISYLYEGVCVFSFLFFYSSIELSHIPIFKLKHSDVSYLSVVSDVCFYFIVALCEIQINSL